LHTNNYNLDEPLPKKFIYRILDALYRLRYNDISNVDIAKILKVITNGHDTMAYEPLRINLMRYIAESEIE